MDQPEETPTLPERYYSQKAAETRRAAEAVTTRAIKTRLHGLVRISFGWPMPPQTPDTLAGRHGGDDRLPHGADNHSAGLIGGAAREEDNSEPAAEHSKC